LHLARARGRTIPHGIMTAWAAQASTPAADFDALIAQVLTRRPDHELSAERVAQLDDYLDRH
jgi:hypothetical protein